MKVGEYMLIGFSVSNFKSFNKIQSISFAATESLVHMDHIVNAGNKKVLKSGLIFGANAGGKSNLVKAVYFSKEIILNGIEKVDLTKNYFRICENGYSNPGIFEYRILIDENVYSYGIAISYIKKEIISEWLIRLKSDGAETYIFNRNVDDSNISHIESEIQYDSIDEQTRMNIYLDDFGENISDSLRKKTILSDIAIRSNEKKGIFSEISNVYKWFQKILILFPTSKYNGLGEVAADDRKRKFFTSVISYFDTGIETIESQSGEMDIDKILEKVSNEKAEKLKLDIVNEASDRSVMVRIGRQVYLLRKDDNGNIISTKMLTNHGNMQDLFEYADESDGTKRLFDLIPLFYEKSSMILIDEIDRSLHSNLTKRFLELFYQLTEKSRVQLIATTHDSNLLDLDLIRQDEIWFIERQQDHSSKIFSLNKFKERFKKEIEKDYLLGRYGAIPIFSEENSILEDIND